MCAYTSIYKIGIFAGKNVGKKSISKRCTNLGNYLVGKVHEVHLLFRKIDIYNTVANLQLWLFIPDKKKFLFKGYIQGSNGFILMYDITNTETLNSLSEWCQLIKNNLDYHPQVLLVGNKLDLEENREVSKEEAEKFKEKHDISSSMEISLKTGENVFNMFKKIAEMIYLSINKSE